LLTLSVLLLFFRRCGCPRTMIWIVCLRLFLV
jgi:hypothetical protein